MTKEEFTNSIISMEKSLYGISISILKNDADAADAVQSAILLAFQNLKKLKQDKYFKTWITRILINECFKVRKSRKNETEYDNSINAFTEKDDEYSFVFAAVMELEEDYRLPIILHYIEGYSVSEIHTMLGISESNVKVRLHRARTKLKEILKGDMCYGF